MTKISIHAMNIWHLAVTEMRSCTRMARTWLLVVLGSGIFLNMTGGWSSQAGLYSYASLNSPAVGVFAPRYMIAYLAQLIVVWLALCMFFFAFDIRSRDVRDRVFEVLDSRPVTNLELLAGRLLGPTILLIIPVVLIMALILVMGFLNQIVGGDMGGVLDPISVLTFLTWDVVPHVILWGTLTLLLSMVLRFRVAVALAALGIMLFYFLFHVAMPLYLKTGLSTFTSIGFLTSDIAPQFITWDIFLNRTGVLILASSFLLLATGLYPRTVNRPMRPQWIGAGLSVFLVGVLTLGGLGYSKILELQDVERWASVHKEHQSHQQTDIQSIEGSVEIRPGRSIKLDLTLVMAPQTDGNLDAWLFSLNPGYRIGSIAVNDEVVADDDYEFKDGILRIPTANSSDSASTVHLVAQGVPDPLFAYLDSELDWKIMEPTQAKRLLLLGHRPYVFQSQYFALLSGVSWFPTSGSAYGKHVFETHKRDFFDLNLEVRVPKKWIVAGPGTRQSLDSSNTGFRFKPSQPVPEFALIGSKFVRRSFETNGIEFELLLSPKHTKNLSALASAVPALQEWVARQIDSLERAGLRYPFGTLSFVEVPTHLRVYGGGWNMGSAYSPPGIHMIRESGFPMAQFHSVKTDAEKEFGDDIESVGSYLFEHLKRYFQYDFHGGSPMVSLGEQLLGYQATPHGKGATAIHAFVNELAGSLALEGDGVFSVYFILEDRQRWESTVVPSVKFERDYLSVFRDGYFNRARVWKPGLYTALTDLNFETQPRNSLETLLLKSYAISRTVRELVPREKVGAFLGRLISDHRGRSYTEQDFFEIASETGIDFESLVGDWLNSTELPGFLVRKPFFQRVPNEEGKLEYHTVVVVRNDEPVPGAVSIDYTLEDQFEVSWADTVHLPGNTTLRVTLRTDTPVERLNLHPHLSLNSGEISRRVSQERFTYFQPGESVPYVEKYDWVPAEDDAIVVDDLSDGFSIVNSPDYSGERDNPPLFAYLFGPNDFTPFLFYGLPSTVNGPDFAERGEYSVWYRQYDRSSHGKYDYTYVSNAMGAKESQPRFSARLPSEGRWLLEFHLPDVGHDWRYDLKERQEEYFWLIRWPGIHRFEINSGDVTELVELDLFDANTGWHRIGIFDTNSRDMNVTIVEVTDGVAIADAIRWTRVE